MLKKLFIKDYKNVQDTNVRNRYGIVAGTFGIITNFILFLIKLVIGIISNSVTIIADSFNNLSDSGSCIVTIIGFKLANKPADKEHPYGHARYEYIAGIIISLLILSMGVVFAKTSIENIFFPEEISINFATYLVLIIAIIGKVVQLLVYLDFSKAISSTTIKANAIDARNDIISTTAVLIAVFIMGVFKINIDAYMGLVVSIFIIVTALNTLKETINPLLGMPATKTQIDGIKKIMLENEEIKGIHDLVVHNYGAENNFATVHAEVSSDINIVIAHNIIDSIEKKVKKELGIEITIHIDPLELNDEKTNNLKIKIEEIFRDFDDTLKIHDFRMIVGDKKTKIIFDVIIPFDKEYTEEKLKSLLKNKLENEQTEFEFIITIDRPFY